MKAKIFNVVTIIISLYVLVQLIVRKDIIYAAIGDGLNIWVNNLIPALFPFFIISDILINYNITSYIPVVFKKMGRKLFNITDNMLTILLLSMISGFPSNARNTRALYDKGKITLDEANHIMIFSHFSNPVFILTTVGLFFFHSNRMGIILLIGHYLSNFILGFIVRTGFRHDETTVCGDVIKPKFGNVMTGSIKRSVDTILLICGIVCVFLVLSMLVGDIFNFNSYNSMLVKGMFEITIGIKALASLAISNRYQAVIAAIFLAFGGASVHMQVMSQISDTDISYRYFFLGRIYQAIIAGFLTYLLCLLIL